jgi:hypothetical protein
MALPNGILCFCAGCSWCVVQKQLGQSHVADMLPIVRQVWAVLTDYDALADFIPALAVSERLQHPSGDANLVRLRQVLLPHLMLD